MGGRTKTKSTGVRASATPILAGVLLLAAWGLAGCGSGQKTSPAVLTINSEPPGAQIQIGGETVGTTPYTYRSEAEGDTYVILRMAGYKRANQRVSLKRGVEQQVTVEMVPERGYLTVESDPSGADVYLNGVEHLGTTPFVNKPVVIGEYTYELRMENYETLEKSIGIQDENYYRKNHALIPLDARINCTTSPSNAVISVNGERQEVTSPAQIVLPPGTYTITAYVKGYITAKQSLELGPNETQPLHLALKEGYVPPGMVLIPAGEFIMGVDNESPDESPQQKVSIDAYYIDENEVTNEAYKKIFTSHTFKPGEEQFPVLGVSWEEANEYARKIGKRLPTESEWEKAARGSDARLYPWGIDFDSTLCNIKGAGRSHAEKIGQHRAGASPYGCMDMAGNAYEWTSSIYDRYKGNTKINTEYGNIYRVLRGGSFLTPSFDARCSARHFAKPDTAEPDFGFRCAMDIVQGPGPR